MKQVEDNGVHERFCRELREANEQYVRENKKAPSIDRDWMNAFTLRVRKNRRKRLCRVCVMMLVLMIGSLSAGAWLNSESAYGGKRVMLQSINLVSPLDISTEYEDGSLVKHITANEHDNVSDMKRFFSDIYEPDYLPAGYSFGRCDMTIYDWITIVQFSYGKSECEDEICITFEYWKNGPSTDTYGEKYKDPKTGKELYVQEVEDTREYSVTDFNEHYQCTVTGIGRSEDGIKVINSMRKVE